MLKTSEIQTCLDLIGRAIVCASWLAATTRREWTRFKEFIAWIRTGTVHCCIFVLGDSIERCACSLESARASKSDSEAQPAQHDLLEVNEYLVSGLAVSSIDKWFMGPVPRFTPQDLGVPSDDYGLHKALASCHTAINDKKYLEWQGVCIMTFALF